MKPFFALLLLIILFALVACQPVAPMTTATRIAMVTVKNTSTAAWTLSPLPSTTLTANSANLYLRPAGSFGAGWFPDVFRSPDGKRIFVPMNGKELRWYDAKTLQQEGVMVLSDYPFSPIEVIFGPDPNIVAVVGFTTFVIDLRNQKILASILGTETYLSGLQFSSDTKLVFFRRHETYNHGFSDQVRAWDIEQDHLAHSYWESEWEEQLHDSASVTDPAISPDGNRIAAGYANLLQIRDVETEELLQSFKGHNSEITSVAFSKDGLRLASVDIDGVVQLWNSQTGQKLDKFLLKLETQALKLSFSEDDQQLMATLDDSSQQVVDLQTGRMQEPLMPAIDPLAMALHQQGYSQFGYGDVALAISPDGKILAVGSETVLLWDIQTQKLLGVLENPGNSMLRELQFDPTGHLLAGITYYQTLLWDVTASAQPNLAKVLGPLVDVNLSKGLSFSSDGKYIAVGRDLDIDIWDVEIGQKIRTLRMGGNPRFVLDTQFLVDDQSLYAVVEMEKPENAMGITSQIQIWNIKQGQMTSSINLFGHSPYTSAFRWPLFAFENGDNDQNRWIEIWNLETGKSKKVDGGLGPTFFSKNSDLLFGVFEGEFCIWQVDSGKLVYTSPPLGHDPIYLRYSLDILQASNFVATHGYQDGIIQLFDISVIIDEARQP